MDTEKIKRPDAAIYTNRAYIPETERAQDKLKALKDLISDVNKEVNQNYLTKNGTLWDGDDKEKKKKDEIMGSKRQSKNDSRELNESVLSREQLDIELYNKGARSKQPFNIDKKKTAFLQTTAGKVVAVIGAVAGLCVIAGGTAGLSYYLGSLSKLKVSKHVLKF
jgi:hypothetical protein